jgi:hypothetical protein
MAFRVFAFQRIETDHTRTEFTVRADMSLLRRYDLRVQELPLLCRRLLEGREGIEPARDLTFTEADMCLHQKDCAAFKEAAAHKKPRPAENHRGGGWRTTPLHL